MKKMLSMLVVLAAVAVAAFSLSGCVNGKLDITNESAMLTAVELSGYNLGFYVGKSKTPDDDAAVADAYEAARTGKIAPEKVAEAFQKLKIENPQLAGSMLIVLKSMGAEFDADGNLVDISRIPVAYWDRAAEGYASGYAFGRLNKKGMPAAAAKSKVVAPAVR